MCDPVSLLMLAGTGVGALGQMSAASAASANAQFQQRVSLDNAKRTTEQMRDASERGADEEQQVRSEGAVTVANMRGALASNNMDITFGSPLDAIIGASVLVEQDAYRVKRNTAAEVRDLEVKRSNHLNSASASAAEAKNAKTAGFIAGVGTALGGGAEIYKYKASLAV